MVDSMKTAEKKIKTSKLSKLQKCILGILWQAYLTHQRGERRRGTMWGGVVRSDSWTNGLSMLVALSYGAQDKTLLKPHTDQELLEIYEQGELAKKEYEAIIKVRKLMKISGLSRRKRKEKKLTLSFRVSFSRSLESLIKRGLIENLGGSGGARVTRLTREAIQWLKKDEDLIFT